MSYYDTWTFPENLRRLRGAKSQRWLAHNAKVSVETISALERGTRHPSLALAMRLADVFDVTMNDLFGPVFTWQC